MKTLTREQKMDLTLKARNLAAIRRAKEAILKQKIVSKIQSLRYYQLKGLKHRKNQPQISLQE